ncbi:MAG: hypothetical protein COA94_05950 [Rickettsiales bacterium]|nr:MAG: hypothetical protein COA94_05950 [Rickettsiales bacterium]
MTAEGRGSGNGSGTAAWASWPSEILTELQLAVKCNDAKPDRRVSLNSLINRWKTKYKTVTSRDTIRRYWRLAV